MGTAKKDWYLGEKQRQIDVINSCFFDPTNPCAKL
jgi:hypothetical protein